MERGNSVHKSSWAGVEGGQGVTTGLGSGEKVGRAATT